MNATSGISLRHWFTLILLGIIWGSSFILMKKALTGMGGLQLATIRIGVACLCFLPYILWVWKKINWKDWYKFLLVGLTTTGIPSFCFAFAQTKVSSATAGILNSLTPVFTLLIGVLFFRTSFQWRKLLGVVVGFIGAGLLIFNEQGQGQSQFWYTMLILLATICYGINTNAVKKFFPNTSSMMVSAGAFVLVGFPGVLYMVLSGDLVSIMAKSENTTPLLAAVVLSLLCTVIANILFYDLVQKTNALFGSSVTFLIPVVAILWGIFDGEKLSYHHLTAVLLIVVAVWLLRKK